MIGLNDGAGMMGICGYDVRFCDCGKKPAPDRHEDQFKPKTPQGIVNDVYLGGAVYHMTRANVKSILKGTPSFDMEPSDETAAECRRMFAGWE